MNFINQMEPSFDMHEADAIYAYMKSGGWCTEFKKTREFEQMICDYTGAKHCWIMANGTVSLSAALMAVGVGVGDEVICPDYTMTATPNSAELIGAKAVFVDIDRKTLCMDFRKMREAVTEKTKAVLLVSINGRYPENMEEYAAFCRSKGIHLIEDAAQSLGSFCHGRHLGRFGEIGESSWFGFSLVLDGRLKGKRGALVKKLDEAGIEVRPIVADNFTRNPVIGFFNYTIPAPLVNADDIHENGFLSEITQRAIWTRSTILPLYLPRL